MTKLFLVAAALFMGATSQASELDPSTVPQEIIVREDASGNREVFKVAEKVDVTDKAAAEVVIRNYVTAENQVQVFPSGELDRVTSTEAWYYWNYNWYGYSWYGYSFYYRPYYSYYHGYYSYYYYRWY